MASFVALILLSVASWAAGDEMETRMAWWASPRAAVIRDTLFLDGGDLWQSLWDLSTSTWGSIQNADNSELGLSGIFFALNFNKTISVDDEFSDIFSNWTSMPFEEHPPFRSGFLFADDYEFYTFG
jgi:hypothetical protein